MNEFIAKNGFISNGDMNSLGRILSGGTDLYDIFATGSGDVTRVQPGTNITTGGTANQPIINLADSIAISSVSATNVSGGTIYSGSTDISTLFASAGNHGIYDGGGTVPSSTTAVITDTLTFTTGTLKSSSNEDNSLSAAAFWANGASGAILMDSAGQKRLSWNDGGANFAIRSGSYYNGGELYSNNGGAVLVRFTNDSADGEFEIRTAISGVTNSGVTYVQNFKATTTNVVINEGGDVIDFRVEGDTDTNLIRTDAANDRVGIGGTPGAYKLDVSGSLNADGPIYSAGTELSTIISSLATSVNTNIFNTNGTITDTTRTLAISGDGGGNTLSITNGTNNVFVLRGDGNVYSNGIGFITTNAMFGTNAGTGNGSLTARSVFGVDAGSNATTGSQSAFGYRAGYQNSGTTQSAFGYQAGYQNSGGNQSAFGYQAGYQNTIQYQSAFGYQAGYQNAGSHQSAFGYYAGRNNTGQQSSVFGFYAGYQNKGANLTSMGYNAGRSNEGANNSFFGNQAGYFLSNGVTVNTGSSQSVFVGSNTKAAGAAQANQIVIGYNAIGNGANTATLGNTSIVGTYLNGIIYSAGTPLETIISSVAGADTNFANTDLTVTGTRVHDVNGNTLIWSSDGATLNDLVIGFAGGGITVGHINFYQVYSSSGVGVADGGGSRISVNSNETIINESNQNVNFRIVGDTDENLFFADAGNDRISIGTVSPTNKFHVSGATRLDSNGDATTAIIRNENYTAGGAYGMDVRSTSSNSNQNVAIYALADSSTSSNVGITAAAQGTAGTNQVYVAYANVANSADNYGMYISVSNAGAGDAYSIVSEGGHAIFNENGGAFDFRIEGDTDTNLFFADGSRDQIGIGGASTEGKLEIHQDLGAISHQLLIKPSSATGGNALMEIRGATNASTSTDQAGLIFSNFDNDLAGTKYLGKIAGKVTNAAANIGSLVFYYSDTGASLIEGMRLDDNGQLGIGGVPAGYKLDVTGSIHASTNITVDAGAIFNESGGNNDFRIESDSIPYMMFVDASTNRIGINNAAPSVTLEVSGDTTITGEYNFVNDGTVAAGSGNGYGEVVTFGTGTLTAGNLYYLNSSLVWTAADADSVTTSTGMLGIALGTSPSADGVLIRGFMRSSSYTQANGAILYVSTTAGGITSTAPSGAGDVVRVIGYMVNATTDTIYFNPSSDWIEL